MQIDASYNMTLWEIYKYFSARRRESHCDSCFTYCRSMLNLCNLYDLLVIFEWKVYWKQKTPNLGSERFHHMKIIISATKIFHRKTLFKPTSPLSLVENSFISDSLGIYFEKLVLRVDPVPLVFDSKNWTQMCTEVLVLKAEVKNLFLLCLKRTQYDQIAMIVTDYIVHFKDFCNESPVNSFWFKITLNWLQ